MCSIAEVLDDICTVHSSMQGDGLASVQDWQAAFPLKFGSLHAALLLQVPSLILDVCLLVLAAKAGA